VSSILRALKKLEDRPAEATEAPPWRDKFAGEHAHHSQAPLIPWRSKPVIAVAAVVLVAAGWLVTHRPPAEQAATPETAHTERLATTAQTPSRGAADTPVPTATRRLFAPANRTSDAPSPPPFVQQIRIAQQKQREEQQAHRAGTPQGTTSIGPQRGATAAPPTPITDDPTATAVSAPAPEPSETPGPPAATAARESTAAAPTTPERRGSPASGPPLPTKDAAAAPATPVTAPSRPSPVSPPRARSVTPVAPVRNVAPVPAASGPTESPEPTLTRLRDDAVKLQAVAWSSDPERRMAVINEQIVREGNTIEGYTIATIREESVVVRKGGASWELRYGH
jgi:hypothetical protein